MNYHKLLELASFTPKSLQPPNSWIGHLPFAAWIIREVSPKIFVELGTHTGNSYFSFCQAVSKFELSTKCFAIDTWQGDEHAGFYNDDVFNLVNMHNHEYYERFSCLLRMSFDDAVSYFADESIEMLHVDGLHTYEAVLHDFETWLPKLAPGAVVIFHDTNVRERNFGVWKLWEELQVRYPDNLEFIHSHGLGVLQLNNVFDEKKINWLQHNSSFKKQLISYFAALGTWQLERFEVRFSQTLSELSQTQNELNKAHHELSYLQQELSKAHSDLSRIVNSRTWRWGNKIADIVRFIFPAGSLRRRFINFFLKFF